MSFLKTKESGEAQADFNRLPRHAIVIMDGNDRWVKHRSLFRMVGHAAGAETSRGVATYCQKIGLEYFTVYALSMGNWKHPLEGVSVTVGLLKKYLLESIEKMEKDKIKLYFFNDLELLSQESKDMCRKTNETFEWYGGVWADICFNYGGRDEIVWTTRHFATDCVAGGWKPKEPTEVLFSECLYSNGVPDPDLVIRPSEEVCISNFLLWQSAYVEFYFTDVPWSDSSREELHRALAAYQDRSRRFGGV